MDDILEYENLVWSIVAKYGGYFDKDDLYQVGMMGLISAYQHFDKEKGVKFSTYAYQYIFGEVYKYVQESRTIRVGRDMQKLNRAIERGRDVLRQTLMREPTDFELSTFLEIDEEKLIEAKASGEMVKSLDSMTNDDMNLYSYLGCEEKQLTSEVLDLKTELASLNDEDRKLIYSRYFMDLTQREVSEDLGISQVQVSRKESKVLNKLKTRL